MSKGLARPIRGFLSVAFACGAVSLSAADGDIRWSVAANDTIFGSPAVDKSGNLYFGAEDGKFYSFNADGQHRWTFVGAEDWIDSSPAIGPNGVVYFGSWDNRIYALDSKTGQQVWSFETGSYIVASPVLGADGTIYVGSADGLFYAVSPDGALRWQYVADGEIEGSAVLDSAGHVYFATTAGSLYSIDTNGGLRWKVDLSSIPGVTTAETHGVYAGLALDAAGRVYVGSRNHHLFVFEPNGQLAWSYETTDYVDGTPVIGAGGKVYMASRDGYLYALDKDGFLEWELLVGDVFYASPAIDADGTIYVTSYAGGGNSVVQAVSPEGVVEWSQTLSGYNDASIAIGAGGSILVGMHNNSLYALEEKAALAQTAWPKFGYDPQQTHTTQWGLPVGDAAVLSVFTMAKVTVDEWYYVDWIGLGWFRADSFPWINHWQHGWWWCGHATASSYWVYDTQIGWLYLLPTHANLLYSHQYSSWLSHAPGSSVYVTGRWFFNYNANGGAGEWFHEPVD